MWTRLRRSDRKESFGIVAIVWESQKVTFSLREDGHRGEANPPRGKMANEHRLVRRGPYWTPRVEILHAVINCEFSDHPVWSLHEGGFRMSAMASPERCGPPGTLSRVNKRVVFVDPISFAATRIGVATIAFTLRKGPRTSSGSRHTLTHWREEPLRRDGSKCRRLCQQPTPIWTIVNMPIPYV